MKNKKVFGRWFFSVSALALGCCLFPALGSAEKAADEFYFVDKGNEVVKIDGIIVKAPSATATLSFVRADGSKIKEYPGDAEFQYLVGSDGKRYKIGDKVEKSETYSAVWGQSKVELPNYYEQGYKFNGWLESKGSSIVYGKKEQYSFNTCTTLYPFLMGNRYTLNFSDSDASVSVEFGRKPQNVHLVDNKIVFMDGNNVVKTVNGFNGYWHDGIQYYDSSGRALLNWDVPSDAVLEAGFIDVVDAPSVEKKGYEFIGWSNTGESADVTTDFQGGVYYEVLKQKTYNVKIADRNVAVVFGEKLENVAVPSKFGYKFSGYYLKDGEKTICLFNEEGRCMEEWRWDGSKDIFARWAKLKYVDKHKMMLAVGTSITYNLGDKIEEVVAANGKCSYGCNGGSITFHAKETGAFKCIAKTNRGNFFFEASVKKQPQKVSVGFSSKKLRVGQMIQLKPTVGSGCYANHFYYKSSSPSNVSVNAKGYVEALKKGTAIITVTTSNNKKCKVKVIVRS